VDRASAGDAHAFGELYERFLDPIYRYLYVRLGSRADAEDLAEQVFLKAWEAIGRFKWQGKPFLAWLYRVAHNVLVDFTRARKNALSLNDDERPLEVMSEAATVELGQTIDAELLAGAVSELTEEQQQVITLKFLEGYDNARIAQVMDKREGAIRALQLRALLSLRRVLQRQGLEELA
jgi:RNA polymerase sigma-70 factor (ECF subfamily)